MLRKRRMSIAAGAVFALLLPCAALAAPPARAQAHKHANHQAPNKANHPAPPSPQAPQYQQGPITFEGTAPTTLALVHHVDRIESEAGRLAQSHSTNFQVREFGQRLMMDATLDNQRVNQLAKLSSAPVPPVTPQNPNQQEQTRVTSATLQELHNLHGPAFDVMFLQLMQQAHYDAIAYLAAADQKLPQSRLRVVVYRIIPVLAQEYQIASTLNLRLNARGIAGGY